MRRSGETPVRSATMELKTSHYPQTARQEGVQAATRRVLEDAGLEHELRHAPVVDAAATIRTRAPVAARP
jgi:hypothetical protein